MNLDTEKVKALVERRHSKNGECWDWTGYVMKNGYGQLTSNGKSFLTHRASYMAFKGEIPTGLQIDHLCKNTRCVNPVHLEAVTPKENLHRSSSHVAENVRKTHCPRGHEYAGYNLKQRSGRRFCRTCTNERRREKRINDRLMDGTPAQKED